MNKLPEKLNAHKIVTYDTRDIIKEILQDGFYEEDQITVNTLLHYVRAYLTEDFGGDYDVYITDETGSVVPWV